MSSNGRCLNAIPAGAEDDDSSDDDFWLSSAPAKADEKRAQPPTPASDPYSDICTLPGGNQRSVFGGFQAAPEK